MYINAPSIAVLAVLVFAAPLVAVDSSAPSHSCTKPGKAADVKTQLEADKFNEAVSKFKSCMEAFIQQQQDAAANHQRAATQATNEWMIL